MGKLLHGTPGAYLSRATLMALISLAGDSPN